MHIPQLMIEVTRRCQLECLHCLRGDTQPLDIDKGYIRQLVANHNITSIGTLTFTGGEPFLNIEAIAYTVSLLEVFKVEVDSFYIATNGILFEESNPITTTCLGTIFDLWLLCSGNEFNRIDISIDEFHETKITESNLLKVFSFTHTRGGELSWKNLIPEGRGEYVTCDPQQRFQHNEFLDEYPDDIIVYLTAKGEVVWNCDLSYEHQDRVSIPISKAISMVHRAIHVDRESIIRSFPVYEVREVESD